MAKGDVLTQAKRVAWDAEISYIERLALEEVSTIYEHGSPEVRRVVDILTAYYCVGLWRPNDYFSTRQQERECKQSSKAAMAVLRSLLLQEK
jgi:hypothetical protein